MNHKVEALDEVIFLEKKIISSSTAKIFSLSEIEKIVTATQDCQVRLAKLVE